MDIEEFEPRKPKTTPKDLGTFSGEELHEYISILEAEIARARAAITAKESHKLAASQFFKN